MKQQFQPIVTRLTNEDDGKFITFSAFLVSPNVALAIFDEQLEIHLVKPTIDPGEFDLIYNTHPMFHVGSHAVETVFEDVATMPLVEFARKYSPVATGALLTQLRDSIGAESDNFASLVGISKEKVETLEQHGVTLGTLQGIVEKVFRK